MSQLFLSHSSIDNAQALGLHGWLIEQGWDDLFLDLDPQQGIVAVRTTGKNQHGDVVCTFERTMLIWKTGFGPADD